MSTLDGTHQCIPCDPPVNTGVFYEVSGEAPNRVLTVEWHANLASYVWHVRGGGLHTGTPLRHKWGQCLLQIICKKARLSLLYYRGIIHWSK